MDGQPDGEVGETEPPTLSRVLETLYDFWDSSAFRTHLTESSGLGLSDTEARCVWLLHARSPQRGADLARRLGMGVPAISKVSARLRLRGLVAGEADPSDARATLLQLTAEGQRAAECLQVNGDRLVQSATLDWTAEEREFMARLVSRFTDGARAQLRLPSKG